MMAWIIVDVFVLMLFLSWVRKPLSAYVIGFFIPLPPAAFLVGLWVIALKGSPVWELIFVGGAFMLLPIMISIQFLRDNATRKYFHCVL